MGYLDNSSITVDAVLTKKGREILKNGGSLNITSFTLSDTGVDYTLWNPSHPSGAEYNLRNRLISLNQNTVAIPAITLGNLDSSGGTLKTFKEGDENTGTISIELVGYNSTGNVTLNGFEYYFVIQDPSIISTTSTLMSNLSGTSRQFLQEQDIPFAQQYGFNGNSFTINPIQQDTSGKQTNVYIVHVETGAYNSFTVTNNITKNQRAILSTVRSGT